MGCSALPGSPRCEGAPMTPDERLSALVRDLARVPETNAARVELSRGFNSVTVDAAVEAGLVQWRALSRSRWRDGRYPPALYLTPVGRKRYLDDERERRRVAYDKHCEIVARAIWPRAYSAVTPSSSRPSTPRSRPAPPR